ncbi:hypothetical protein CA234_22830 [Sphingomonas sp. ABOLE]|nr:hypothetical protein CA234_22830 [Sphingomonas sp. ABOLE]
MPRIRRHPREGGDPLALMVGFFSQALSAMDSRLRGNDDGCLKPQTLGFLCDSRHSTAGLCLTETDQRSGIPPPQPLLPGGGA